MQNTLFVLNLLLAGFMTGLIWYVQLAQYPLFSSVGEREFVQYHVRHSNLTTLVVILPMTFELGTSGWLLLSRPDSFPLWAAGLGLGLNLIIWAATGLISVPLHSKLGANGHDLLIIGRLVATNWLRTIGWTARLVLLTFFLFQLLK